MAAKLKIKDNKSLDAFAIIVDINKFTHMVSASEGLLIAQFTRDVLDGAIRAIEERDGEVVGFMGDAILGLVRTAESTLFACCGIAEDVNKQCEYISTQQEEASQLWEFSPGGPSLKIGVEYGDLDVSTISSRFLGDQKLV